MTTAETPSSTIDVRTIEPRRRHALIFSTFAGLEPGQALHLVNDHDPSPLRHQFAHELAGHFDWRYLQSGPEVWRVAITRLAPAHTCCGACGG
jgi:uncharacterized protein (DUF2249 family)